MWQLHNRICGGCFPWVKAEDDTTQDVISATEKKGRKSQTMKANYSDSNPLRIWNSLINTVKTHNNPFWSQMGNKA